MSQVGVTRLSYDTMRNLNSPNKILSFLRTLGLSQGDFFDEPLKLSEEQLSYWGFEAEGISQVYPLFVFGELRIFLVELQGELTKSVISQTVRKMEAKGYGSFYSLVFADKEYSRLAFTTWLKISSRVEIENLIIDRERPVRSDLETFEDLAKSVGAAQTYQEYHKSFYEALSKEKLTQRFFEDFSETVELLEEKTKGIEDDKDRRRFALLVLTRLMFLYFLQKKGWLDGDRKYISVRLNSAKEEGTHFYDDFLKPLFFEVMNTEPINRSARARKMGGDQLNVRIPYLNGGLFEVTPLERVYSPSFPRSVKECNDLFTRVILGFFEEYRFTLREDLPESKEVGIDPELMGKVFEEFIIARERKVEGAYYTPKEVVGFMSRFSIYEYLGTRLSDISREKLADLVFKGQTTILNQDEARELNKALQQVKIVDPAVGSGAFLYGVMIELQRLRAITGETMTSYEFRKNIISHSIYGVDIEPSTIWMAELRLWLSLIEETENFPVAKIPALPNLDHRLRIGNSLVDIWEGIDFRPPKNQRLSPRKEDDLLAELQALKEKAFEASSSEKAKIERTINGLEKKLFQSWIEEKISLGGKAEELRRLFKLKKELEAADSPPIFLWYLHFEEVFKQGGFDIVIMNPPYVNTKLVSKLDYYDDLEAQYEFVDDLYNHFAHRAFELTKPSGVVTMITSDTYFYLESKQNMRELLQSKSLSLLMPTMKVFKQMVDTAILSSVNRDNVAGDGCLFAAVRSADEAVFGLINPLASLKEELRFTYGSEDYIVHQGSIEGHPDVVLYRVPITVYRRSIGRIFFEPGKDASDVFNRYMKQLVELDKSWSARIQDSKTIRKSEFEIETYRESLQPGSVTFMGLLTEGAQGLATGDNGRFVALLEDSDEARQAKARLESLEEEWAEDVKISRAYKVAKSAHRRIEDVVDALREKFSDSDLGTHGLIYRTVTEGEVADTDDLLSGKGAERIRAELIENGIPETKPHWVPYDKGDKEGNRWFHESPYYVNWSRKSVKALQNSSEARWQGYDYFFLEGFSWTDVNTDLIKCRLIPKCVNDVKSMKLTSRYEGVSDEYLAAILNSRSLFKIKQLISPGNTFQIGHARIMPVVIPSKEQKKVLEELVRQATKEQARLIRAKNDASREELEKGLAKIEGEIDNQVEDIYGV